MNICSNCKQFVVDSVTSCDHCDGTVCGKCIVIVDEVNRYPFFNAYFKLCSSCQCAGCIQEHAQKLSVGYDKCKKCHLQFCSTCFENSSCGQFQHVHL